VDKAIKELKSFINILDNLIEFAGYSWEHILVDFMARLEAVLAEEGADAQVRWSPVGGGDEGSGDPTHCDAADTYLIMARATVKHIIVICWEGQNPRL
jgi:hypothetical protein